MVKTVIKVPKLRLNWTGVRIPARPQKNLQSSTLFESLQVYEDRKEWKYIRIWHRLKHHDHNIMVFEQVTVGFP